MLENKLSNTAELKDASDQTLYQMLGLQATNIRDRADQSLPSSSVTLTDSPVVTRSSTSSHRLASKSENVAKPHNSSPVGDLLGLVDISAERFSTINGKSWDDYEPDTFSDEDRKIQTAFSKPGTIGNESALPQSYIHRFGEKTPEKIFKNSKKDKIDVEHQIESSDNPLPNFAYDADSESPDVPSGSTSPNAYFSSMTTAISGGRAQEAFMDSGVIPLAIDDPKLGIASKLHEQRLTHTGSKDLSPAQRWARYCEDVPIQYLSDSPIVENSVTISEDVILAKEGPFADMNAFRYRDKLQLCFNPSEHEEGVYRAVIISDIPIERLVSVKLSSSRWACPLTN